MKFEQGVTPLPLQPTMSISQALNKISKEGSKGYLTLHTVFQGEPTHKDAKVHYHRN